jgi:hypothetical protein
VQKVGAIEAGKDPTLVTDLDAAIAERLIVPPQISRPTLS